MIHPTYPCTWNKKGWINQSCLPPSIASGYRGSPDTSSAERLHFWPGKLGWGEGLCVLAEGLDSPWLMGTLSWDPSVWVSPLTEAEAEGAEPTLLFTSCVSRDTLGQFPTCLGNCAGSWKQKQNRLECVSQGKDKTPESSHMRLETEKYSTSDEYRQGAPTPSKPGGPQSQRTPSPLPSGIQAQWGQVLCSVI